MYVSAPIYFLSARIIARSLDVSVSGDSHEEIRQ